MLVTGLLGARITALADDDGIDHARRGLGLAGSRKTHGFDRVLIPALHEIFLETELACRRVDPGFDTRVAHRKNARRHAQFVAIAVVASVKVFPCARYLSGADGPRDRDRRHGTRSVQPSSPMACRQKNVSPFTPQPRSLLSSPAMP